MRITCVLSVIDEREGVIYEKRYPNDLKAICDALESFRNDLLACVVESTNNWFGWSTV